MKKFYLSLFAMICSVAFTASAMGLEKSKNVVNPKTFEAVGKTAEATTLKKLSKKAPASRAGISSLEDLTGDYTWMYINLFKGATETEDVTISIYDASTNSLLIEGLFGGSQLLGVADLAAGTISISPIKVGYNSTYQEDIIFVTCDNIGTEEQANYVPAEDPLVLTYAVDEEGEYFQTMQAYGLVGRDGNGNYTNADGYYKLYLYAIVEHPAALTLLGTATVSGDVLYTTFLGPDTACPDYEVEVYVTDTNPNLYILTDFLRGLYDAIEWNDEVSPNFEIDATDPSNISLMFGTTDINGGSTDGVYYYTSMNQNYETIDECPAEYRGSLTITDKSIQFSFPAKSTLLYASTANKLYYGNSTPITITIAKENNSGVENIAVEDANAPAEFFNLQGQRVAAPVKGNFYIKRQGTTTSKVVF